MPNFAITEADMIKAPIPSGGLDRASPRLSKRPHPVTLSEGLLVTNI